MGESVVVPILVEVAKPMVEVLVRRITEEIHHFQGFKKELEKLEPKINMIVGMVLNMNDNNVDEALKTWLRNALRIINKAEDMLDVLAYEKHHSIVMKGLNKRFIFWPALTRVYFRHKMGSWIRSINSDIEEALKQADTIAKLKSLAQTVSIPATRKMTNDELLQQVRRNVDMSVFVGRDSDVRSMVHLLCNSSQHNSRNSTSMYRLPVVAIVGIGGMGKTTLAKQVYDNKLVVSHFSERIWISDLKDFNIQRILNEIVGFLTRRYNKNAKTEAVIRNLEEYLGGKRYLLVLDDVWITDQQSWDALRNALERIGGSTESIILTTTRDDAVAKTMHACAVHCLSGLSEDDSWSLFQPIAFANMLGEDTSVLKTSGRKIVEKCKGVPLAIKSIAGLLQSKRNPHEWTIIEESELWDIPHQETGILPSLKLSYDHLSSPFLKKCFSLCALWPKGTRIRKYGMRDRWIALSLIQKPEDGNLTMEDICEDYFVELLRISFLIVHKTNEVGEATVFFLHDLVYDAARSVATNERLYFEDGKKRKKALDIQHISVTGRHAELTSDNFPDTVVLENIRSLDTLYRLPRGLLRHVKYLRVLSLEHSNVGELPETIGRLKCLKYLDLGGNPIQVLPRCITKLYNLQALILYHCEYLIEIHGDRLGNLVNLQHLGLSFDFCPVEGVVQQLSRLHTLPALRLIEGGFQISELGNLLHIRGDLEIKGLELVKSKLDAESANLSKKDRVEQLRLRWDNDDKCKNYEEVLDGLSPHPNLKLLSIKGYAGDKFPSWLMKMNVSKEHKNGYAGSLCNLIKFELSDCGRCQHLPTLGHLSSLKKIAITNMDNVKNIGPEFYNHYEADSLRCKENQESSSSSSSAVVKSFASLKELELRHLGNLVEWCEPGGGAWCGFPFLEKLWIEDCLKLERMPNEFPCLRELSVMYITSSHPLLNIMSNKRSLKCLKKLDIVWVKELTHIPEELGECTSLQTLCIISCHKLTSLPENLWKLVSLEVLTIGWCHNLVSLPNLSGLGSLREIDMFRNDGLRSVPEGLQSCKSLEMLSIRVCEKVETLPDLSALSRLSDLSIVGMTKMIRQPPGWLLYSPFCLRILHIGYYQELNEFPDLSPLLKITSLQGLYVYGWKRLQSVPEQPQHFTNLKFFGIADFENLKHLPDWIGNLSSLQSLVPTRCKRLKKLPSEDAMKRLTKLKHLRIEDCPMLEEATKINGPEHHKIVAAGIYVEINNSTKN